MTFILSLIWIGNKGLEKKYFIPLNMLNYSSEVYTDKNVT